VREDLGCLSEVVSSSDAREVHQLFAYVGARTQDIQLAQAAFQGLLALEHDYEPNAAHAPRGSLLRQAFDQAVTAGGGPTQPLPASGWFVDGKPGAKAVPTERVAVVQLLESDGGFRSWYVEDQGLPDELAVRLSDVGAEPNMSESGLSQLPSTTQALPEAPPRTSEQRPHDEGHASRGLFIGGVAMAVVGAAGLAYAEVQQGQLAGIKEESAAREQYERGLGFTLAGSALGLTGSGLILGAVIKGQW